MAMPKSLVTIFLDDKEISKKIFQLESVEEIVDDCKSNATLLLDSELLECDRILKFSPEFNEFIDIDCHDFVQHMDKFQVFFKTREASMLTEQSDAVETNQIRDPIGVETLRAVLVRKGASVLADYEASGTLSESSRKLIVKIAVSELIERKGFYPQSEDKSKLARSMVALFPSLKIKMGEENEGFEHFYDPISHSGFLEIRLRNLRRNLQDDQRRYQRKRVKSTDNPRASIRVEMPAEGDDSVNEWMTVIKRMRPCQENLSTIKEAMDKTYASRRLWIAARHPTLEEFFAEFPRFVDMPYMFDTEFGKMFPGKDDMFIRKWEGTIIPKILKMSTSEPAAALTPVPEDDGWRNYLC
ncbi:uncharacterized protein LOC130385402 isoform X2 [Gadus chalcogrammus]|uniref:uncharacterized protein LOC130385402 isoform X2 n=1 Tax=Gadus chalcogrammus TaxID=1042646 RepID=UPI0024C361EE|nr:uncharacterized protein LOC130385402 isoform X2 [Gadus chalcogrammus]